MEGMESAVKIVGSHTDRVEGLNQSLTPKGRVFKQTETKVISNGSSK